MKCQRSVKKVMDGRWAESPIGRRRRGASGRSPGCLAALGDPVLNIAELEPDPDAATDAACRRHDGGVQRQRRTLSELSQHAGGAGAPPGSFALLRDRSPDLMKRVLRAGADELLFLPLDPGDATRALLKISETRRREEKFTRWRHHRLAGEPDWRHRSDEPGGEPGAGAALHVRQTGGGGRSRSADRRARGVPESRARAHDHGAGRGGRESSIRFNSNRR